MELLDYLLTILKNTSKPVSAETLAEGFIVQHLNISKNSIEFGEQLEKLERRVLRLINKHNEKFAQDQRDLPFQILGSSRNLIKALPNLSTLESSLIVLAEDENQFADRVGREVLKKAGCTIENIHITPQTRDAGIDYWGVVELPGVESNFPHNLLIIGQVKQYSTYVPVEDVREFVGAVHAAIGNRLFGDFNVNSPKILHFITTGEISSAGQDVAKVCEIHIISRRHLAAMNLLLGDE